MIQKKLHTHIWFDTQAVEAAQFYTTVFDAEIEFINKIQGTPSGDCDIVGLRIEDAMFQFISAGPYFSPNPSISFTVACASETEAETFWNKLSNEGKVLMEYGDYPFATKYGWCEDKYGVSWQISYAKDQQASQRITPSFLFVGDAVGKAEAAMEFYTSIFPASGIDFVSKYGENPGPDKPEYVNYGSFHLVNQGFVAMDSAMEHKFGFTEGISIIVYCKDQEEIDKYWSALSAVPEAEQCGWLKDKFGVSWQIVPMQMERMMNTEDEAAKKRVTEAFLKMKKFDLAALEKAFNREV
jgi:predicted 3-demethylubiquinone-9 3-methyltransferase (glyoxalase superfamily)